MSSDAGRLRLIRVSGAGFRVCYQRPDHAQHLLGRSLAEALAWTDHLHGPLGTAYRVALARAAEAGAGERASPARARARDLALLLEQVEAMARRVGLDLPRAVGAAPLQALLEPVLAAVDLARQLLGPGAGRGALTPDRRRLGEPLCRAGAAFDRLVSAHRARPRPRVLGAGAGPVVAAAWSAAQAVADELAAASTDGLADEGALPPILSAEGAGSAPTIRGRLVTTLRLEAGRIVELVDLTPTDRLFAPHGPGTLLLAGFKGSARDLGVVMAALDPDVPWEQAGAPAGA